MSELTQIQEHTAPRRSFLDSYRGRIMIALRRISHFEDQYSKKLSAEYNVTGPQLLCLHILAHSPEMTLSQLSKVASQSGSTTNGIVDRLEMKGLARRERQTTDRRKVIIRLTEKGKQFAQDSSLVLQDKLNHAISELPELKQATMAESLEEIVKLMGAE
ncbi:Regulator of autolytic activity [Anaerohalosphaera lusitana]|uniref:Regulator of autolytic activity n=1 Tax=Anaerohalosphaera lusitana TaxID=1936003 RepID=A0A1U9NHV9_9BACT|nr:MarR family transcriptional regulator [Anaerohalosphaera lusitana]AQT67096.1 Regulator of autolytic activity [Anaerohalosphaera lusitana]